MMTTLFDQNEFDIRCEWGAPGVTLLAPLSDAVVIVDVLSFSTCVDVAVGRGATVYPYARYDESALTYAESLEAILAYKDRAVGYSLSPTSLMSLPADTKLVLPSPNGATLSLLTGDTPTYAGCVRNAQSIAQHVQQTAQRISIIPAGERWPSRGEIRFALEDILGAGAIIHYLQGTKSPEALAAEAVFLRYRDDLTATLQALGSGKELVEKGTPHDVVLASQLNVSTAAPRLIDKAYRG
jgi:2-phosphosulfolactate phosphatase